MQVGLVGLGRMGARLRERMGGAGHDVTGYDRDPALADVGTLEDLVARLDAPRVLWVMVPAGTATDAVFATLEDLAAPGDLLIDGGNSNFRDSMRRHERLSARGLRFLDVGVSGGVFGGAHGFCLMAGGAAEDVARIEPLLEALASPEGAWAHVGAAGAGHYTKMCHNAIEYAVMQAYGEGFDLLGRFDSPIDAAEVARLWNHGSIIRSWLLELVERALDADANLEGIAAYVEDSGEGRWAVQEAVERGVPAGVIAQSLFRRFESRDDNSYAMRLVAALRREFGEHQTRPAGG